MIGLVLLLALTGVSPAPVTHVDPCPATTQVPGPTSRGSWDDTPYLVGSP